MPAVGSRDPARLAASAPAQVSDSTLVVYADVVLLFALLFFALCALPRVLARYAHRPAWASGWRIRKRPSALVRKHLIAPFSPYASEATLSRNGSITKEMKSPSKEFLSAPPHFPAWSSLLHPLSTCLSRRFFGRAIGRALLLASYTALMAVAMFYKSDPVTNVRRAGYVALSQYPIVFALGAKNSLVGILVAKGHEKIHWLHRFVGRAIFLATLFHIVGYLVKWTKSGSLTTNMKQIYVIWGIVALGFLSVLAALSASAMRTRAYNVFYYSHIFGAIGLLISTCYHVPQAIPWAIVSLLIYLLDLLLRCCKSHFVAASITAIPEMGCTRIVIPTLYTGWRAGQHVRLRVLCSRDVMWMDAPHPFTIASVHGKSGAEGRGLVLYCKKAGDWTNKLYALANGGTTAGALENEGYGGGREVNLLVEGPYGGPGNAVLSSFSAALIVVGGSGITFGLPVLQEAFQSILYAQSHLRIIEFIWVVQESTSIQPLVSEFSSLLQRSPTILGLDLSITVHYTRASSHPAPLKLPRRLVLRPGRPQSQGSVDAIISRTSGLKVGGKNGVVVAACGPRGLVESFRLAEQSVDWHSRRRVGGLEFITETFEW
ncbi:hypothetical protein BOTBODRAFT_30178 [Botryobasidium botryosum FD-172 SS1]|uniref:ferric-chelate reductase (NADPH) n=1 Tax=Botryobasidium botryosum (strain FD-172 SS1) TaxID=930990 RepID=A0A067N0T9_BOTB1|nr:hypothetical protein BOTBODRAFT_30178 [Botryobasidium botryosum FD-172 SS1]